MGKAHDTYGRERNEYRIFMEKAKRKRLLGIPKCTWGDNIKVALKQIGSEHMDWINTTSGGL
jgi:hypothetical protein